MRSKYFFFYSLLEIGYHFRYHLQQIEPYNLKGVPHFSADFLGRKFNDVIFGLNFFFVKNGQHERGYQTDEKKDIQNRVKGSHVVKTALTDDRIGVGLHHVNFRI